MQNRILIWQGLENLRAVLLDLLTHGIKNINQTTLDKVFSSYNFQMINSRRDELINEIKKQLKSPDLQHDIATELQNQLNILESLDEELIFKRNTQKFSYEYVLKSKYKQANLSGFIKIQALDNPDHRGLVSWQQNKRDPLIFLVELAPQLNKPEQIYFHINLGTNDGLAIISEEEDYYLWTHYLAADYADLANAEFGSVSIDKDFKDIKLLDGNIAAATAFSKAQAVNQDGMSVFENNVKLMMMFRADLQSLDFSY